MYATKMNFVSHFMVLGLLAGALLAGCSSNDSDSKGEPVESQSTGPEATDNSTGSETSDFDGSWRANCFENRVFGEPEDSPPDGYTQSTLTIDSEAKTYSLNSQPYTDSQCITEDSDKAANLISGDILFDGLITTSTGLEATVVRYFNDGTVPDLTGLLYRENDVLYRELRRSTLIEDEAPTELSLSNPWLLVN